MHPPRGCRQSNLRSAVAQKGPARHLTCRRAPGAGLSHSCQIGRRVKLYGLLPSVLQAASARSQFYEWLATDLPHSRRRRRGTTRHPQPKHLRDSYLQLQVPGKRKAGPRAGGLGNLLGGRCAARRAKARQHHERATQALLGRACHFQNPAASRWRASWTAGRRDRGCRSKWPKTWSLSVTGMDRS